MFKKSSTSTQHDLFTSSQNLLSGKSLKIYDDQSSWHNEFRNQVTMRIDESIFEPLYSAGLGSPNASIRVMVAMMVLKEAEGLSDQKLFEDCRFNLLTRSAIGLLKVDEKVPTQSTYYLFRRQVDQYAKKGNANLFDLVFSQISKDQCLEFDVSGQRIRMDSKLLGSNIAWLSRYELVHQTLSLFYKQINTSTKLEKTIKEKLDSLLKLSANKIVYTLSNKDITSRLGELGELIYKILPLFCGTENSTYETLKEVFEQQYEVSEAELVLPRKKEEISAKSIQSPHDTDCHYRDKDGNKIKGYSMNVTESCDDDKELNLIGSVDVRPVSTSDVDFFQDDIEKVQEVFPDKIEYTHADGAYHSPDNQCYCKEFTIDLHLHAIQGAKGRYQLDMQENQELTVFDTKTNQQKEVIKIKSKNDIPKWRIKTEKGYRYFTQKDIDTAQVRKKIDQTPIEILQKRNNVEATIFQVAYHYPNAKSRYRGLNRHQMWANIRCLWVNFVRILKYLKKSGIKVANSISVATDFLFGSIETEQINNMLSHIAFLRTKSRNKGVVWEKLDFYRF